MTWTDLVRGSMRRWVGRSSAVIGLVGVIVFASWLNSYRFFLIVGPDEVRIRRGAYLPIGHRRLIPRREELRPAYAPFSIPNDLALARGTQVFMDRVELDQTLFRILYDVARYALESSPGRASTKAYEARDPALAERAVLQLSHIPGLSLRQRSTVEDLVGLVAYHKGRRVLAEVAPQLESARRWLKRSSGAGGVPADAERLAVRAGCALAALEGQPDLCESTGRKSQARRFREPETLSSTISAPLSGVSTGTVSALPFWKRRPSPGPVAHLDVRLTARPAREEVLGVGFPSRFPIHKSSVFSNLPRRPVDAWSDLEEVRSAQFAAQHPRRGSS